MKAERKKPYLKNVCIYHYNYNQWLVVAGDDLGVRIDWYIYDGDGK